MTIAAWRLLKGHLRKCFHSAHFIPAGCHLSPPPSCNGSLYQVASSRHEDPVRHRKYGTVREDPVVEAFKATVRLSRLKRGDPHSESTAGHDWAKCKDFALKNMSTNTSYRIANVFKCCKDESFVDEELFGKLVDHAMQDRIIMNSFMPVGVSMTVQCLGMLGRKAKKIGALESEFFATTMRDFVGELLGVSIDRCLFSVKGFGVWELSGTVHGMGLMFSKKGEYRGFDIEGIANVVVEEFVRKGQGGGVMPQSLSNVLVGCAYLHFENLDLISQICSMAGDRIREDEDIGEQVLANIVWSLGQLGFYDAELLEEIQLLVSEELLHRLKNQELANLVEGLGLLEFKGERMMKLVGEETLLQDRLERFKQQELANVLYGLGLSGVYNEADVSGIVRQITKPRRLRAFKAQSLMRIIQGMAHLDYHNRNVLTLLGEESCHIDRLGKYSSEELYGIIEAFRKLKFWVDPVMSPMHEELDERESTFSPRYWRE